MTLLITKKTTSLKDILNNKKKHHRISNYLTSIVPEGVSISGFTISANNVLSFTGSTNGISTLKDFIQNVVTKQASDIKITKVSVGGLSTSASANSENALNYNFSINLAFE